MNHQDPSEVQLPEDTLLPEEVLGAEIVAMALDRVQPGQSQPGHSQPGGVMPGEARTDSADSMEVEIARLRALRTEWRAAFVDGDVAESNGETVSVSREVERKSDAFQAARVAQRVLERTTREDLRRRGDFGLVLDFVSDRLRDSLLLRVAAALLVVQVTIVPLVALHLLRERRPAWLNVDFEASSAELARELEDDLPEAPLDVIGGSSTGVEDTLVGDAVDHELESNAAALHAIDGSLEGPTAVVTPIGAALRALTSVGALGDGALSADRQRRAREALAALRSGEFPTRLSTADGSGADAALLHAVLATEARLFAVDHGLEWHGMATELEGLVGALAGGGARDSYGLDLAGRAVAHALRAGVALPAEAESLGEGMIRPLSHDDARLMTARGSVWIETLVTALRRTGAAGADPYVAAWISASERLR